MDKKQKIKKEIELAITYMANSQYVEKRIVAQGLESLYSSCKTKFTLKDLSQFYQLIHDSWDINLSERVHIKL